MILYVPKGQCRFKKKYNGTFLVLTCLTTPYYIYGNIKKSRISFQGTKLFEVLIQAQVKRYFNNISKLEAQIAT